MRILRLKADGFGCLRGEYRFSPGQVSLVVDRNESGKSSLLAAISAALYGLEGDRRSHKVLTPVDRWRPWDGGAYRVELDVECEGEVYTVKRDFDRGTVEVWNDRGIEVTASFREGKDAFPVGKKLAGLEVDEFEKCALVRQGELDLVVPADERARRVGTLQARLESAADTRGGDTSAAEALQVLQAALRRYTAPEVDFTGTVENAVSRLELKREMLASELRTLEHDRAEVAGPLQELARLGAEEQAARDAIARLEAERHAAVSGDLTRRLREAQERRAALEQLREESASLTAYAHVPADAEAELRETIAQHEAAQRNLATREERRREEQTRRRGELEVTLASLQSFAACTVEDADRLVALAGELRRLAAEEARLQGELVAARESLSGRGYAPTRVERLTSRFATLDEAQERLLGGQAALALAFQTEVAGLEEARTGNTETLRRIDGERTARKLPGWLLAALGVGAAVAGGVVLGIHGEWSIGTSLLGGGAGVALLGLLLVAAAAGRQREEREEALRQLTEAQHRLNELRQRRSEGEVQLAELARSLGFEDSFAMMREWNEHQRLQEETDPVRRAQERLDALEGGRRVALAEVRERLDRAGGGPPDPAHLESVAAGIRHRVAVGQQLADLEQSWSWVDEEKRLDQATVAGLHERAVRLLEQAGMSYDPALAWAEQVRELAERARRRTRLELLERELIPQAEQRLAPGAEVAEVEAQLTALEAEAGGRPAGAPPGGVRPLLEIDRDVRQQREAIEFVQRVRGDLRQQVDEVVRRAATREPELLAERACIEEALARARRFRRAVELAMDTIQTVALETHRRWADFLNRRVSELLSTMGAQVEQVRFGEDLDFSLRLRDGQQSARGKALLQLSAGARDQLHLAVRLAICEFLSKPGNPLPLLFDDVFATSDDERTRAGLHVLIETFAREHQVLLVTCHRQRHEHLSSLDPGLWSGGVQWLELRAMAGRTA
jgi:DNA repair exonuclease SbcCD ATPase subunit